jgi:hypothetical protein
MALKEALKLMRMALDSGDPELIMMAKDMVDSLESSTPKRETDTKPKAPEPVVERPRAVSPRNVNDDFTMVRDEAKGSSAVPVNQVKREIQFVDDGSDRDIATPSVSPSERKRKPFKKVSQVCGKCSQSYEVHPAHARDNYICDRCIRSR